MENLWNEIKSKYRNGGYIGVFLMIIAIILKILLQDRIVSSVNNFIDQNILNNIPVVFSSIIRHILQNPFLIVFSIGMIIIVVVVVLAFINTQRDKTIKPISPIGIEFEDQSEINKYSGIREQRNRVGIVLKNNTNNHYYDCSLLFDSLEFYGKNNKDSWVDEKIIGDERILADKFELPSGDEKKILVAKKTQGHNAFTLSRSYDQHKAVLRSREGSYKALIKFDASRKIGEDKIRIEPIWFKVEFELKNFNLNSCNVYFKELRFNSLVQQRW